MTKYEKLAEQFIKEGGFLKDFISSVYILDFARWLDQQESRKECRHTTRLFKKFAEDKIRKVAVRIKERLDANSDLVNPT